MDGNALTELLQDRLHAAHGQTPLRVAAFAAEDASGLAEVLAEQGEEIHATFHGSGERLSGLPRSRALELREASTDGQALMSLLEQVRGGEVDAVLAGPLSGPRLLAGLARTAPDLAGPEAEPVGLGVAMPEGLGRPLLVADLSVHAEPDVDALEAITRRGLAAAGALGAEEPRAALLAAVEVANPGLPVTVAAQEAAERFSGQPGVHVAGPLSMDLAVSEHAARIKGTEGRVPGRADLLVAPNLTVARGVFDALLAVAGAPGGIAFAGKGLTVALTSRINPRQSLLPSLQLAALLR